MTHILKKTRRCHVDRSGDISYIVFRDPSSLRSVGMTLLGQHLYYHFKKSNDIAVDPVALSYRTNQRSTPEGAKVNVGYLLNIIMRFLPFGRNDTTMTLWVNIYIIT